MAGPIVLCPVFFAGADLNLGHPAIDLDRLDLLDLLEWGRWSSNEQLTREPLRTICGRISQKPV